MNIYYFIQLLKNYGLQLALIVVVVFIVYKLIVIVLDEDIASAFRARVFKSLFKLTGRREDENKYIRNDINSKLNSARKKINYTSEVLPRSVDIEWVEGVGEERSQVTRQSTLYNAAAARIGASSGSTIRSRKFFYIFWRRIVC